MLPPTFDRKGLGAFFSTDAREPCLPSGLPCFRFERIRPCGFLEGRAQRDSLSAVLSRGRDRKELGTQGSRTFRERTALPRISVAWQLIAILHMRRVPSGFSVAVVSCRVLTRRILLLSIRTIHVNRLVWRARRSHAHAPTVVDGRSWSNCHVRT